MKVISAAGVRMPTGCTLSAVLRNYWTALRARSAASFVMESFAHNASASDTGPSTARMLQHWR